MEKYIEEFVILLMSICLVYAIFKMQMILLVGMLLV